MEVLPQKFQHEKSFSEKELFENTWHRNGVDDCRRVLCVCVCAKVDSARIALKFPCNWISSVDLSEFLRRKDSINGRWPLILPINRSRTAMAKANKTLISIQHDLHHSLRAGKTTNHRQKLSDRKTSHLSADAGSNNLWTLRFAAFKQAKINEKNTPASRCCSWRIWIRKKQFVANEL